METRVYARSSVNKTHSNFFFLFFFLHSSRFLNTYIFYTVESNVLHTSWEYDPSIPLLVLLIVLFVIFFSRCLSQRFPTRAGFCNYTDRAITHIPDYIPSSSPPPLYAVLCTLRLNKISLVFV